MKYDNVEGLKKYEYEEQSVIVSYRDVHLRRTSIVNF